MLAENKGYNDQWGGNSLNTYFVLNHNTNIAEMEAKFPAFMSRHMDDPDINTFYKLYLQPLNQVHLGSMDIEHGIITTENLMAVTWMCFMLLEFLFFSLQA